MYVGKKFEGFQHSRRVLCGLASLDIKEGAPLQEELRIN